MSDKPNPHPTKHRLDLAQRIAAGLVEHYHGWNTTNDGRRIVTARVREFVHAGLADLGKPADDNTSTVRLTDAGQQYLDTYGKNGADG